jgi:hypothetical protein
MRRGGTFFRRSTGLGLLSNLILSLDLEEASGDAIDSSGNGRDFTDQNTVGQTIGATAGYNAREFIAANSEFFTVPFATWQYISNEEWAAHMWLYRNGSSAVAILSRTTSGNLIVGSGNARSYSFYFTGSALSWIVGKPILGEGAVVVTAGSGDFPDTTWTPALIWHDPIADQIGIKVGSAAAVTATIDTGVRNGSVPITIGSTSTTNGSYLNGAFAALRMWRGPGVIEQIVNNADAIDFLNSQQRRHSDLT